MEERETVGVKEKKKINNRIRKKKTSPWNS